MKQFEHEIMTFDLATKKGNKHMAETLQAWGAVGFELVSVVPTSINATGVTVFLKREISLAQNGDAA
ncbi:hypothetical protein [Planktotalea arctica]|uniref:hypothetical protein n=1 Tax=Planktotalea arctica TaxID=1481893 RepID=UPI00321A5732